MERIKLKINLTSDYITRLHNSGERMVPERSDSVTFWEHIYRYRFACRFVRNKNVLDIACGEGYGAAALLDAGATNVVGIDLSENASAHAHCRYGINTCVGSAEDIPIVSNSVDVVVSFETIEHLSCPSRFLDECSRVLVHNGIMIVSTPDRTGFNDTEVFGHDKSANRFHLREFSLDEFSYLIRRNFDILHSYWQWSKTISWYSIHSLASFKTPWLKLRGVYRLRQMLRDSTCSFLWETPNEEMRISPVEAIRQANPLLSHLVNPYEVRKRSAWIQVEPRYLIAVAKKRTPR